MRRAAASLLVVAATAFSGNRRTPLAPGNRPPRAPLVDALPPAVRAEGARGLAAYSAVELCWWGAPASYAFASAGGDASLILESAKAPFLVALLLWPNSWFRNGLAVKIARLLE